MLKSRIKNDEIKDKNSVAAAIEFAVLSLKVKDIIVCGHSNCGAMQAIFKDEREFEQMPHLRDWLRLADSVRNIVLKYYPETSAEIRQRITEEENVLCQLHNIQTYPFVQEALNEGVLHLHGWHISATSLIQLFSFSFFVKAFINFSPLRL
ncbi:MAG: hypothetical protein FP829_02035 [Nitrospirae bacterium]|nr:hypothetical protein [Nitrospirota bacterium]MBA3070948.1 hypothetical protein [Nitrospirota bacterium]